MAKKNTSVPAAKGDIDFEKELWDVSNELRGAVAENQYKDYVLSLLFVKHLSERRTAGLVKANSAMTTGSAGENYVREYMITQGMEDCIVQMPEKQIN